MQKKLEELNLDIQNSELQRIPLNTKKISAEEAVKVIKLLDLLEENDDVHAYPCGWSWHNLDASFFEKELKSSIFADQFLVLKGLNEILDYNE